MMNASINEAASTATTVSGTSRINVPNRPSTAVMPAKAMIVVTEAAKTGPIMREAPPSAASAGPRPRRSDRKSACSPTTMASSTTMPRQMISAKSDTMLSVMPLIHMNPTAAAKEAGMPIATQKAVRADRKRKRKIRTRTRP